MVRRALRAGVLVLVFTMQTSGCSDDEAAEDEQESGTCRGIEVAYYCTEVTGGDDQIESERLSCRSFGGTWTTGPCPTANLIGCCRYRFADGVDRECYYTGRDITGVVENCTQDLEGEWTPMGR